MGVTVSDEIDLAQALGYTYCVRPDENGHQPAWPMSTYILPQDNWWTFDGTNIIVTELTLDDDGNEIPDDDADPDDNGNRPSLAKHVAHPVPAGWKVIEEHRLAEADVNYHLHPAP